LHKEWLENNATRGKRLELSGIDFRGINLINLPLRCAVLRNANFEGCSMTNSDFKSTDLTGASFAGSYCIGTDFSRTTLTNANFDGAYLVRANFRNAYSENADFTSANLTDSDLRCAEFIDADFTSANLTRALFCEANLTRTNLEGVHLCATIGNSREIRTIQTDPWTITYTDTDMAIGCKQRSIKEWMSFDRGQIAEMDFEAVRWWELWKPIITQSLATSGRIKEFRAICKPSS
jgi:hypothetical protein